MTQSKTLDTGSDGMEDRAAGVEDYVLVPCDPTDEMIDAGDHCYDVGHSMTPWNRMAAAYQSMIAAAPKQSRAAASPTTNTVTDDAVERACLAWNENVSPQDDAILWNLYTKSLMRAALTAALSTHPHTGGREAVIDWQPIETAPRDSKARLVWCPENRCTYCVSWGTFWISGVENSGWLVFGGCHRDVIQRCTHWLPLPSPPALSLSPPLQKTQKETT